MTAMTRNHGDSGDPVAIPRDPGDPRKPHPPKRNLTLRWVVCKRRLVFCWRLF
jgi:hypothetical protein